MASADQILALKEAQDERWILSCDGGGVRGIISLRCLEAFERFLGKTCIELFDMFAGTSTGALIAGALASGRQGVGDLIGLYRDRRNEVFSRSGWSYVFGRLATKYDKKPVHRILCDLVGDIRLADCRTDILITATDTVKSETTFFSSFLLSDGSRYGTYQAVRLRDAMEGSMSAPTYFAPHGRFIDGGVGVYNNPCYVAAVEALRYSFPDPNRAASRYVRRPLRVFAFGTGAEVNNMEPGEALKTTNLGWASYVIGEGMDEARTQQSFVSSEEVERRENLILANAGSPAYLYRYQVVLSRNALTGLGVDLPDDFDPGNLTLDATDDQNFSVLDEAGMRAGAHFASNNFNWSPNGGYWERSGDPTAPPPGTVPPSRAQREAELQAGYLPQVLEEFDKADESLS